MSQILLWALARGKKTDGRTDGQIIEYANGTKRASRLVHFCKRKRGAIRLDLLVPRTVNHKGSELKIKVVNYHALKRLHFRFQFGESVMK